MIYKKRPDLDIILDILNAVLLAQPNSVFIQSLLNQYQERGSLSKKQLQGLYSKAAKVKDVPPGKLASLEAIILKMPNRFKSTAPAPQPPHTKEEGTAQLIEAILAKYPQHKRVLFLKSKYENNEPLTTVDTDELKKFSRLLT